MSRTKNKRKKSNLKRFILIAIILIVVALYFAKNYYTEALLPMKAKDPDEIDILIPASSSTNKIAEILKDNGLIRDSLVFNFVAIKENMRSRLKAGQYTFSTDMSLYDILSRLTKGSKDTNIIKFTIPEGYELEQIAEKLTREDLVDRDVFLKLASDKSNFEDDFIFLKGLSRGQSLEGFLFPSTYEVYKDVSEEEVIEKMLSQFEKIYESKIRPKIRESNLDLNEIITFASIIEREARVDKERPIMAGVVYNRLEIDMRLQVDATVQYALGERKERLLYKDLEVDSPYNTYLYKGLPPGPISSPGESSIMATMNPADVDYLFYVLKSDNSGEHIFTKTYEEHLEAQE